MFDKYTVLEIFQTILVNLSKALQIWNIVSSYATEIFASSNRMIKFCFSHLFRSFFQPDGTNISRNYSKDLSTEYIEHQYRNTLTIVMIHFYFHILKEKKLSNDVTFFAISKFSIGGHSSEICNIALSNFIVRDVDHFPVLVHKNDIFKLLSF